MSGQIDVRRTEGGLRLLVPMLGERPRKTVRLSYAQAGSLVAAIRAGLVQSEDGRVTIGEPSREVDGCEALARACAGTYMGNQDLHALGTALGAHMPDRMTPLPAQRPR